MILSNALTGTKIVDLTRLLPGPLCTRWLCDMGAEVIKIEDPHVGDYAKHYPPLDENGVGVLYQKLNEGKTFVEIDLKEKNGKESLLEMVQDADIVVESFRPGVMEKMGIGFDQLKKRNPQIILCSISGYGQKDEKNSHPGHDINYLGWSGILSTLEENGSIPVPGFQLADIAGGSMTSLSSILAALHQVKKTNEAIHLDVSMTHSLLPFLAIIKNQLEAKAPGIITGESACYSIYKTKDEKFMALGAMEKKFWDQFCNQINKPEWLTRHPGIGKEFSPLKQDIQTLVGSQTREYWTNLFMNADACFTPVLTPIEVCPSKSNLTFFPL
ncbi:MAG: CoA transferase [Deltaproteobacteria bacterium]|nr:MAG: CoA transferase [Deltaproteobacteria bacterium]